MKSWITRVSIACFCLVAGALSSPDPASAQIACGPQGENGVNTIPGVQGNSLGGCPTGNFTEGVYDTLATTNFGATVRFNMLLPDAATRPPSSGNNVKIHFTPTGGLTRTNISAATCPGGTISGLGTGEVQVSLPDGGSCALFVAAPNGVGGVLQSYETTLSRAADAYAVTAGTLTGGLFGGTVTLPTPGPGGPTAQDKSNTVAALQSVFNSATPDLLGSIESFRTPAPNGNGVSFTPTGLGIARSRIDGANPFDRAYGPAFAPRGYFDGGQKVRRGNGFNFSVDLTALGRSPANDTSSLASGGSASDFGRFPAGLPGGLGLGRGGSKDGAPPPHSRFVSFVKGSYVDFDDGETNADRDGHLWVVTSGVGLRVSPDTTIGVLSRYRSGEADSNALSSVLESDFWGGGAFLTTDLGNGLRVAVAGIYELGDNDIRIGADTGSFDSEHLTIEGRIDKRLERGTFWIEPGVGLRYIDTDQDNYTDSSGTFVTNQDLTLGRLTYGPKIGTTLHRGNATVKPYARIGGVWDFENDGNFATSTAGTFTSGDHGFNGGGGIEVVYLSGFSVSIQGDWTTYDNDLDVWSVSGGIGTPLSALGLGQVGFVSLDLAASQQDASAQARLRIPLGTAD